MRNDEFIAEIFANAEFRKIIVNVIRRKVPGISVHDIEDCFSEVFEIALKKDLDLGSHPNIRGWLTLTAKNVAKRFLTRHAVINNNLTEMSEDFDMEKVADPVRFEERIEAEEQEKAFFDFLKRKLTKSDYNLYILKFLEYHSNDEISTILNVKNDTVNKRVTRLKQKLRKIL
ncbi:MAG: sigma-70 family RNA polymerase sigma factor [Oscillospiraceae bacterium]|nr:sigma-70 family RNA polymerase sigma factor [Oscillospiraceae bacterium]